VNTGLLVEVWRRGFLLDHAIGYHMVSLPAVRYSNEVIDRHPICYVRAFVPAYEYAARFRKKSARYGRSWRTALLASNRNGIAAVNEATECRRSPRSRKHDAIVYFRRSARVGEGVIFSRSLNKHVPPARTNLRIRFTVVSPRRAPWR